jgi:hypothetical protein
LGWLKSPARVLGVASGQHFFHIGLYQEDAGSCDRLLVVLAANSWSELGEIVFRRKLSSSAFGGRFFILAAPQKAGETACPTTACSIWWQTFGLPTQAEACDT